MSRAGFVYVLFGVLVGVGVEPVRALAVMESVVVGVVVVGTGVLV